MMRVAWLLLAGTPRLPFVLALLFVTLVFSAHAALLALLDGPELLSPRGVERQILIVNRVSPVGALPSSYQREIGGVPGVAGVSQLTFIGGYLAGAQRQQLAAIAVEPEELLAVAEDTMTTNQRRKRLLGLECQAWRARARAEHAGGPRVVHLATALARGIDA